LRAHRAVLSVKGRRARSGKLATPHVHVPVYFTSEKTRAAVYRRQDLMAGDRLRSPSVVTEYSSTTLIPPGAVGSIDSRGNLVIEP
jgi:N-methylhydantoinase A